MNAALIMWPVICFSTLTKRTSKRNWERERDGGGETDSYGHHEIIDYIWIWLPHSSTNHIRKLRVVIFLSGKIGNDFEMDDLAEFLECHSRIIVSCCLSGRLQCCCLCVAWFLSSAFQTYLFDEIGEALAFSKCEWIYDDDLWNSE